MLRQIIITILITFLSGAFSLGANAALKSSNSKVSCLAPSVVKLSQHPTIIKSLNKFNTEKLLDPITIDNLWPSLNNDSSYISSLLNNSAAILIRAYISQVSLTGEGFLIGLNGGLVAATNRTSDYWQGDEAQFLEAIRLKINEFYIIGEYEDASADSRLIKIAAPVFDLSSSDRTPIGVLVIGFDSYVLNFKKLCDDSNH